MFQLISLRRLALSSNTGGIGSSRSTITKGSDRSANRKSIWKSFVRKIQMNLIAFHLSSVQRGTVSSTNDRTSDWYLTPESEKAFGKQQHRCCC